MDFTRIKPKNGFKDPKGEEFEMKIVTGVFEPLAPILM
jgi:hypothetical protein